MSDYPSLVKRFNKYNKTTPTSQSLTSIGEDETLVEARKFADKPINRFRQFLEIDESEDAQRLKESYNTMDDLNEVKRLKMDAKEKNTQFQNNKAAFSSKSPLDLKPTMGESTNVNKLLPLLKRFKSGGDTSALASIGGGADNLSPLVKPKYNSDLLASNPDLQKRTMALSNRDKVQAPIENAVMTLGPYGALIGGAFKAGRLGGQAVQKVGTDEFGRNKGFLGGVAAGAGTGLDVVGGFLEGFNTKGKGTGEKVLDMLGTATGLSTITGAINQVTFRKKRINRRADDLQKKLQAQGLEQVNTSSANVYNQLPTYQPGTYGKKGLKIRNYFKS